MSGRRRRTRVRNATIAGMPEVPARARAVGAFERVFGVPARVVARAPGRVNLIGEHIDYRGGSVLPMAIDRDCVAAMSPGGTARVRIIATDAPGGEARVEFDAGALAALTAAGAMAHAGVERGSWASYVLGSLWAMMRSEGGVGERAAVGLDMVISSDVPVGAGLSSSAAIEVAALRAWVEMDGGAWDPLAAAAAGRRAEHEFAGVPCGIMDQLVVAGARAGHAMLIDCDVVEGFAPVLAERVRHVPMVSNKSARVVVINTRVRHRLAEGGYTDRVEMARSAAMKLGVKQLCRAPMWDVPELTSAERLLTRHSITEAARVSEAVVAMERGDVRRLGELIGESGRSLVFDEGVSCEELDTVVASAMRGPGCYGARLTGAGFGGCAVAMVWPGGVGRVSERIVREFMARHGYAPEVLVTGAAAGASLV